MSVSVTALGASTVERAKVKASHPATTRHATVSAMIHARREIAVAVVRRVAAARDAASVLTSPPTTGFASLASV